VCVCVCVCIYIYIYIRAGRKVYVHFEYLENRSRGLDVTWQLVIQALLRIIEQSLSRGANQSAVRRR
jgi:hypothetical protein